MITVIETFSARRSFNLKQQHSSSMGVGIPITVFGTRITVTRNYHEVLLVIDPTSSSNLIYQGLPGLPGLPVYRFTYSIFDMNDIYCIYILVYIY